MTPPPLPPDVVQAVTRERLRLLSIGYYISGAIGAAMVSVLLIHFTVFLVISFLPESTWNQPEHSKAVQSQPASSSDPSPHQPHSKHPDKTPVIIFRVVAGVIGMVILTGWTLGGLTIYAGRCIAKRQKRTLVMVMAAWNCLWIPYGTLLGISTFIVLATPEGLEEFKAGGK